jgi:hypothetical protein
MSSSLIRSSQLKQAPYRRDGRGDRAKFRQDATSGALAERPVVSFQTAVHPDVGGA